MPKYKVKAKGFFGGKMYDPDGKRTYVVVDKPFKKCPLWLEPMKAETAAEKKKREAAEKRQSKIDAEKAEIDKAEIEGASFLGSTVETL